MNIRTGEPGIDEDDRLPWLETVEEEYRDRRPVGRILLGILLLVVVAVGGYFAWTRLQQNRGGGNGALIKAPPGEYKVRPNEPGGMRVEGEGDTVFSTSQGAESNASINVGALPEAPVQGQIARAPASTGTRTATLEVPTASAADAARAGAPSRAVPAPVSAGGAGALIQLGAFPTEGQANTAWAQLSKRFGYLAPLGKSVERAEKDGKAIFRLRVNAGSNGQARELCGRLKVAGENCFIAS